MIPFSEYLTASPHESSAPWVPDEGIPHEVIRMTIGGAMTLPRAWREYLGLTQEVVAKRRGVSQSALAQMENTKRPRRVTLVKLAKALGIQPEQLGAE